MNATAHRVTVHIVHRDEDRTVEVAPGETFADVLTKIDYPPQGHQSWRIWLKGLLVPMDTRVNGDVTIRLTHVAMGLP